MEGLLGIALVALVAFVAGMLFAKKEHSKRCDPERIRPETCAQGVPACRIQQPHSHTEALIRRIKES